VSSAPHRWRGAHGIPTLARGNEKLNGIYLISKQEPILLTKGSNYTYGYPIISQFELAKF
jgi:hypothetical protein